MPATQPPLTFDQWADIIYNGNLQPLAREFYMRGAREYDVVCKVETKANRTGLVDEHQGIQGISKPAPNWDLQELPQRSPVKGNKTVIRQQQYRSQLTLDRTTFETCKHDELFDNLGDLMDSIKAVKDVNAVNIINNGTTGSQTYGITEADGTNRALFSTTHQYEDLSGTFSNYLNSGVPPTPDVIYRVWSEFLMRLKDNVGAFISWGREATIWTPTLTPSFGLAADEVVNSQTRPDTANRAVNVLTQGRNALMLTHRQLNYLTSTTKWYMGIPTSNPAFPLRMRERISAEVTPLDSIGATNPHVKKQTATTCFGLGFVNSYRGIVAIGT